MFAAALQVHFALLVPSQSLMDSASVYATLVIVLMPSFCRVSALPRLLGLCTLMGVGEGRVPPARSVEWPKVVRRVRVRRSRGQPFIV